MGLELVAQGPDARQRFRCALDVGTIGVLGRSHDVEFPVPWDPHISRRHVRLEVRGRTLVVERIETAANPLFHNGREVAACELKPGEHFVLGQSSFQIRAQAAVSAEAARPVEELTFDRRDLDKIHFRDADRRIEVLSRLPEVIAGARNDAELYRQLTGIVLAGVPAADAVGVVELDKEEELHIHCWDRRLSGSEEFRPSTRLIQDALLKRQQSVLHAWESAPDSDSDYTEMLEYDWAFCIPIAERSNKSWGIYVVGRSSSTHVNSETTSVDVPLLQADVKFTDLVAEIVSSVRRVKLLERQQSSWRQFFAPTVLETLGDEFDSDLLDPRECDVTVMFCDLRGFSQRAEGAADDLLGLLDRVSLALGVMTREIQRFGGVTGDFQGDSTLGFWGWPIASDDSVLDACRAALAIRSAFSQTVNQPDHPLRDFHMGIGLAQGRAVAGKIGTADQVKVTVFGPVVNLASRLEGMTGQMGVPILVDEDVAAAVRSHLPPSEGRLRSIARVLPYGLDTPLVVSELLPPASADPVLSDEDIAAFNDGVERFIAGEWEQAYRLLHGMPAEDRAQDFLMVRIAEHGRIAPADWDGIIRLPGK